MIEKLSSDTRMEIVTFLAYFRGGLKPEIWVNLIGKTILNRGAQEAAKRHDAPLFIREKRESDLIGDQYPSEKKLTHDDFSSAAFYGYKKVSVDGQLYTINVKGHCKKHGRPSLLFIEETNQHFVLNTDSVRFEESVNL